MLTGVGAVPGPKSLHPSIASWVHRVPDHGARLTDRESLGTHLLGIESSLHVLERDPAPIAYRSISNNRRLYATIDLVSNSLDPVILDRPAARAQVGTVGRRVGDKTQLLARQ